MTIIENVKVKLDLTQNEAKVYSTLVKGTELSVEKIKAETQLPRSRVYEVLSSLASKNLLERIGSGANYRLIPPKQSIPHLIKQREKEYNAMKAEINELGDYLHKVWTNEVVDLSPGVEILTLKEAQPLFIDHLRKIKEKAWIAVADRKASIDMRESGNALVNAFSNDLDIRYLISSENVGSKIKKALNYFPPFQKIKYSIKWNTELHTSFVIIDKIVYIFFFGNEKTLKASTLRTSSSQLVNSFDWMFRRLWNEANQIE